MTHYLIRKNGFYYRPDARGYTASIRDAWIVDEVTAHRHRDQAAGVDIIPLSAVIGDVDAEIAKLDERLADLRQFREDLPMTDAPKTDRPMATLAGGAKIPIPRHQIAAGILKAHQIDLPLRRDASDPAAIIDALCCDICRITIVESDDAEQAAVADVIVEAVNRWLAPDA